MSHTLAYALGVLILIIGVGVSVALHELGHMIPAKRFGVKVPEYFIGFGPRVWSTRRGETEYGVKAIWLGGYVRLLGMIPPAPGGRTDKPGSMIAQAREESLAELSPEEAHRAFYRLSVPRKLVVMAGGILTNLVLGIVLLALTVGVIGQPGYTSTLAEVSACVPAQVDSGSPQCADETVPTPAAAAGLVPGDRIVSWNGRPVARWTDVQEQIAASGTGTVPVVVERDGQELTLTVAPVEVERTARDPDGTVRTDPQGNPLTQMRPYIGVRPDFSTVREPLAQVPATIVSYVGQTLKAIITLPVGLYRAVAAGLGLEERSPHSLISLVGVGRIAGETSASGSGDNQVDFSVRLSTMVGLLGSLNLALFAFNLIPLLPLDGGHVAGACWEGTRRWWARRRGEPDPGYVDTARMLPLGQVVFVLLIAMGLVLVWADIVAPL